MVDTQTFIEYFSTALAVGSAIAIFASVTKWRR